MYDWFSSSHFHALFSCWSACGYLCWVWLWILCMPLLLIKGALLIREKSRCSTALTQLKYEFQLKHWFSLALVKIFEISIKSASKFSRVRQMKSHKIYSIKNKYAWIALVLLPPAAVVVLAIWLWAELLCWLLCWEQTGQTRPNPGKNDNQYTACCENNNAGKNAQKENDPSARTTAADEPDILFPHNLHLNCALRSLA